MNTVVLKGEINDEKSIPLTLEINIKKGELSGYVDYKGDWPLVIPFNNVCTSKCKPNAQEDYVDKIIYCPATLEGTIDTTIIDLNTGIIESAAFKGILKYTDDESSSYGLTSSFPISFLLNGSLDKDFTFAEGKTSTGKEWSAKIQTKK